MMENFFVSQEDINKERQKARELRKTRWWREKTAAGLCEYCGRKFKPDELTMDHIVPMARGGRSAKNNIACACKECNNKKKYLLPMEWEEYLKGNECII
jgi:5-methylcytosine-specific restriction endonuclease McrA